jgi:integrase
MQHSKMMLCTSTASLEYCPEKGHFMDSWKAGEAVRYGKIAPPIGRADHRKTNSCAEAPRNADVRTREYLTEGEVQRLMDAAKGNRWGHRDATMVLVAYRHGLRVSELVDLRWDQVDFQTATLHVRRVKAGTPATHPVMDDELRALRRLQREQDPKSPFVFTSERGSPFTTAGFARIIERAGIEAKLPFKTHPHMLRHACGFALANRGHDTRALQAYLGHKNIQHTVRYTELSPTRFKDFWRKA